MITHIFRLKTTMTPSTKIYNKSDNKPTKIVKIIAACIPLPMAETELKNRGKTKLQLKNSKMVKAGIQKILTENIKIKDISARRVANGPDLESIVDAFMSKFNKRGAEIPSLEDAQTFLNLTTTDLAADLKSLSITSTPQKKAKFTPALSKVEVSPVHLDITTQTSFPSSDSSIESQETCYNTTLPVSQATEARSIAIIDDVRNYARSTESEEASEDETWETVSE